MLYMKVLLLETDTRQRRAVWGKKETINCAAEINYAVVMLQIQAFNI